MSNGSGLSTPEKAREHARAMHGMVVPHMPTIPAWHAKNLPRDLSASDVVWDETLGAGEYCARVIKRGMRVRLINLEGDACASVLVFNARHPLERLNVADTIKVQWNAYLNEGKLLLSDMGRVLMSLTRDTCGQHDTLCGASSEKSNTKKYGQGANYGPYPNARDRFLLALLKHGLGKKDIPANVNFFKTVRVNEAGGLEFVQECSKAGDFVELWAEMDVLVAIVNAPHVLDPRSQYVATPLRVLAFKGAFTGVNDAIRMSCPEATRAFENTEDYLLT